MQLSGQAGVPGAGSPVGPTSVIGAIAGDAHTRPVATAAAAMSIRWERNIVQIEHERPQGVAVGCNVRCSPPLVLTPSGAPRGARRGREPAAPGTPRSGR